MRSINNNKMGLDWIALDNTTNVKKHSERKFLCSFRGNCVAYDPNIERYGELANACYGEEDEEGCYFMTPDQRNEVIAGLEALLAKPESEINPINTEDETYEEWREIMDKAHKFLLNHELIHCWF